MLNKEMDENKQVIDSLTTNALKRHYNDCVFNYAAFCDSLKT
jgi:hypothetical protein